MQQALWQWCGTVLSCQCLPAGEAPTLTLYVLALQWSDVWMYSISLLGLLVVEAVVGWAVRGAVAALCICKSLNGTACYTYSASAVSQQKGLH